MKVDLQARRVASVSIDKKGKGKGKGKSKAGVCKSGGRQKRFAVGVCFNGIDDEDGLIKPVYKQPEKGGLPDTDPDDNPKLDPEPAPKQDSDDNPKQDPEPKPKPAPENKPNLDDKPDVKPELPPEPDKPRQKTDSAELDYEVKKTMALEDAKVNVAGFDNAKASADRFDWFVPDELRNIAKHVSFEEHAKPDPYGLLNMETDTELGFDIDDKRSRYADVGDMVKKSGKISRSTTRAMGRASMGTSAFAFSVNGAQQLAAGNVDGVFIDIGKEVGEEFGEEIIEKLGTKGTARIFKSLPYGVGFSKSAGLFGASLLEVGLNSYETYKAVRDYRAADQSKMGKGGVISTRMKVASASTSLSVSVLSSILMLTPAAPIGLAIGIANTVSQMAVSWIAGALDQVEAADQAMGQKLTEAEKKYLLFKFLMGYDLPKQFKDSAELKEAMDRIRDAVLEYLRESEYKAFVKEFHYVKAHMATVGGGDTHSTWHSTINGGDDCHYCTKNFEVVAAGSLVRMSDRPELKSTTVMHTSVDDESGAYPASRLTQGSENATFFCGPASIDARKPFYVPDQVGTPHPTSKEVTCDSTTYLNYKGLKWPWAEKDGDRTTVFHWKGEDCSANKGKVMGKYEKRFGLFPPYLSWEIEGRREVESGLSSEELAYPGFTASPYFGMGDFKPANHPFDAIYGESRGINKNLCYNSIGIRNPKADPNARVLYHACDVIPGNDRNDLIIEDCNGALTGSYLRPEATEEMHRVVSGNEQEDRFIFNDVDVSKIGLVDGRGGDDLLKFGAMGSNRNPEAIAKMLAERTTRVEAIQGSDGDDTLIANNDVKFVHGGGGVDVIEARDRETNVNMSKRDMFDVFNNKEKISYEELKLLSEKEIASFKGVVTFNHRQTDEMNEFLKHNDAATLVCDFDKMPTSSVMQLSASLVKGDGLDMGKDAYQVSNKAAGAEMGVELELHGNIDENRIVWSVGGQYVVPNMQDKKPTQEEKSASDDAKKAEKEAKLKRENLKEPETREEELDRIVAEVQANVAESMRALAYVPASSVSNGFIWLRKSDVKAVEGGATEMPETTEQTKTPAPNTEFTKAETDFFREARSHGKVLIANNVPLEPLQCIMGVGSTFNAGSRPAVIKVAPNTAEDTTATTEAPEQTTAKGAAETTTQATKGAKAPTVTTINLQTKGLRSTVAVHSGISATEIKIVYNKKEKTLTIQSINDDEFMILVTNYDPNRPVTLFTTEGRLEYKPYVEDLYEVEGDEIEMKDLLLYVNQEKKESPLDFIARLRGIKNPRTPLEKRGELISKIIVHADDSDSQTKLIMDKYEGKRTIIDLGPHRDTIVVNKREPNAVGGAYSFQVLPDEDGEMETIDVSELEKEYGSDLKVEIGHCEYDDVVIYIKTAKGVQINAFSLKNVLLPNKNRSFNIKTSSSVYTIEHREQAQETATQTATQTDPKKTVYLQKHELKRSLDLYPSIPVKITREQAMSQKFYIPQLKDYITFKRGNDLVLWSPQWEVRLIVEDGANPALHKDGKPVISFVTQLPDYELGNKVKYPQNTTETTTAQNTTETTTAQTTTETKTAQAATTVQTTPVPPASENMISISAEDAVQAMDNEDLLNAFIQRGEAMQGGNSKAFMGVNQYIDKGEITEIKVQMLEKDGDKIAVPIDADEADVTIEYVRAGGDLGGSPAEQSTVLITVKRKEMDDLRIIMYPPPDEVDIDKYTFSFALKDGKYITIKNNIRRYTNSQSDELDTIELNGKTFIALDKVDRPKKPTERGKVRRVRSVGESGGSGESPEAGDVEVEHPRFHVPKGFDFYDKDGKLKPLFIAAASQGTSCRVEQVTVDEAGKTTNKIILTNNENENRTATIDLPIGVNFADIELLLSDDGYTEPSREPENPSILTKQQAQAATKIEGRADARKWLDEATPEELKKYKLIIKAHIKSAEMAAKTNTGDAIPSDNMKSPQELEDDLWARIEADIVLYHQITAGQTTGANVGSEGFTTGELVAIGVTAMFGSVLVLGGASKAIRVLNSMGSIADNVEAGRLIGGVALQVATLVYRLDIFTDIL